MNIEFHYDSMLLISLYSGYTLKEAEIIAHSSQLVDDNCEVFKINDGGYNPYQNYISQTMNPYRPVLDLMRIYMFFHFQPGDYSDETLRRKDGHSHRLNCTPNSEFAQCIFTRALGTPNLYLIGIACHAYADTFSHYGFTGYHDPFNAMSGVLETALPNVGHADTKHNPDLINHVWYDKRLMNEKRDNNAMFIQAAAHIFNALYIGPENQRKDREQRLLYTLASIYAGETEDLRKDMFRHVFDTFKRQHPKQVYPNHGYPEYDDKAWFKAAVKEEWRLLRPNLYHWRDGIGYHETHWFKFQEAIKEYQSLCWNILEEPVFSKMQLEKL